MTATCPTPVLTLMVPFKTILFLVLLCGTNAFQRVHILPKHSFPPSTSTSILTSISTSPGILRRMTHNDDYDDDDDTISLLSSIPRTFTSLAIASTLFTGSLTIQPHISLATTTTTATTSTTATTNPVELSTGAIIFQTNTKEGQSLRKTEIDAKQIGKSLLKNRNVYKASLERLGTVIGEELSSPVWRDLSRSLYKIEGDVAPEIRIVPPNDFAQTIKDVSNGKLNIIFNGEIINLSIDQQQQQQQQDQEEVREIVIRAKGVKGATSSLPKLKKEDAASLELVQKSPFRVAVDDAVKAWSSPFRLLEGAGIFMDNGAAFLGSTLSFLVFSYAYSYNYYLQQIELEQLEAEKKKKIMEAKKKAEKAEAWAAMNSQIPQINEQEEEEERESQLEEREDDTISEVESENEVTDFTDTRTKEIAENANDDNKDDDKDDMINSIDQSAIPTSPMEITDDSAQTLDYENNAVATAAKYEEEEDATTQERSMEIIISNNTGIDPIIDEFASDKKVSKRKRIKKLFKRLFSKK